MDKEARVVKTGCFGLCAMGPIVMIYPEGACYTRVTPEDVKEIVSEHIVKGRIVQRLLHVEGEETDTVTSLTDTKFYKKQLRIALRNCGVINPESIDEYIGTGGYTALGRALTEQTPQQIIDIVKKSGIRGRGGAGFPSGLKWQFTADAVSEDGVKFVACNADEGDPGAFMDRAVLEGDPHCVLEAMANPKPRQTVRRKSLQPDLDANLLQLAENIQRALGLKVRFKAGSTEQYGSLEIDYYCEADLDQIYNALNI
jgi:NADP-reducing hydrogenase subunit HndC